MSAGGWSKARLARLDAAMDGHVARGEVPGLVALVARRGEVHAHAAGALSLGGPPLGRDAIFRVASLAKPVTAAAAMILVEECRLRLDDPVDGLLPELADARVLRSLEGALDDTVPAARPTTLRDLLTLRFGLGWSQELFTARGPLRQALDEAGLLQGPPRPRGTPAPDEWIRRVGAVPLMHQPGERWLYDLGIDVLGVLVARAAGQPLDVFLRERVFEPLGMRDTGFHVPPEKIGRFVDSYAPDPATGALALYDPAAAGEWSEPPAFPSGGGGLVSTADDFLAFGEMLRGGGKHGKERILSRPSVELMATNQITPEQRAAAHMFLGDDKGWGMGMTVVERRSGLASPGSFGWGGGMGTSWSSDPREALTGVLMTQVSWSSPTPPAVLLDFWTGAYQAIDD